MTFQDDRRCRPQKTSLVPPLAWLALGILLVSMSKPQIVPALQPLSSPIAEFRSNPKNTRRHNKRNLAVITRSLQEFGQQKPIVVDADGMVIAGHGLLQGAKALGWAHIAAVRSNLRGAEAQAYGIVDNRAGDLSENDSEQLAAVVAALERDDAIDATVTGFTVGEIQAMLDNVNQVEVADAEDVAPPLPASPVVRLGDVWTLGPHRLVCGDCTSDEAVAAMLDGRQADLVFTDPPYNMNFRSKALGGIQNDHLGDAEFLRLILASCSQVKRMLRPGGSYYLCMGMQEYPTLANQMRRAGLPHQLLVWRKPSPGLGSQEFRPQIELMLYGHTGKKDDRTWNGRRSGSNYWDLREDRPAFSGNLALTAQRTAKGMMVEVSAGGDTVELHVDGASEARVASATGLESDIWEMSRDRGYVHPTQKPVELVRRALRYSSHRNDLVVDLFGGSGTTLMAAHLERRVCACIELDPKYGEVILRRFQMQTGIDPVRHDGVPLSALKPPA